MFYSHEILTSRKGGVATVWLVATLGSKSNSKRINRKAILEVDIPKTCQIIIEPEAPMALRLQSNLLYGVSRVFNQQCGYILSDAQIAQANMRALINAVKTSELDPNAGKARPDQLMIQDDPAFLPDFALPSLDIDFSALDISTDESSRRSSILSPHSQRSSLSSHPDADESMLGLIIPSSASGGAGDLGGFILPGDNVSSAQRHSRLGPFLEDEDEGFNLDPGFSVDADGNLIEERMPGPGAAPMGGGRLGSDSAASDRVRRELLEGLQAGQFEPRAVDLDLDIPRFDDDDVVLPDAEPFPAMAPQPIAGSGLLNMPLESHDDRESSETVEVPLQQQRRAPRTLAVDERQELHNADLAQWKTDYPANMKEAREAKQSHKAPALAKKNAAFWVFGAGIGGVGAGLGSSKLRSPLDMFAGDAVKEALTGTNASPARHKRARDDEEDHDSDGEGRRVRPREGDHLTLNDDDGMMTFASDGLEVGRHAYPSLPDRPSQEPSSMPWMPSSALDSVGSYQGSIVHGRGFASSVGGFPTSAGAPSSLPGIGGAGPSSIDRRASRIPSASPLVGRGRERYSSLELPIHEDDDDILSGGLAPSDHALEEFQQYGPAAAVDTQTATDTQWMKATLNQEAQHFLDFVKAHISTIPASADEDEDENAGNGQPKDSVLFEDLLPPTQHSKQVASQALHHILALVTKSFLEVKQNEPYGPIDLALPRGV